MLGFLNGVLPSVPDILSFLRALLCYSLGFCLSSLMQSQFFLHEFRGNAGILRLLPFNVEWAEITYFVFKAAVAIDLFICHWRIEGRNL